MEEKRYLWQRFSYTSGRTSVSVLGEWTFDRAFSNSTREHATCHARNALARAITYVGRRGIRALDAYAYRRGMSFDVIRSPSRPEIRHVASSRGTTYVVASRSRGLFGLSPGDLALRVARHILPRPLDKSFFDLILPLVSDYTLLSITSRRFRYSTYHDKVNWNWDYLRGCAASISVYIEFALFNLRREIFSFNARTWPVSVPR